MEKYPDSFPPGYRFLPTDQELLVYYLRRKVLNLTLPSNLIHEVNLPDYSPQKLTGFYKLKSGEAWYFFTPRKRKYPLGKRPDRGAGDGYWKPTGVDKKIEYNNQIVGYMKSLDFYQGNPTLSIKTDWKMHEYRIHENSDPPKTRNDGADSMKLDEWVLCKIYKKSTLCKRNSEESNTKLRAAPWKNLGQGVAPIFDSAAATTNIVDDQPRSPVITDAAAAAAQFVVNQGGLHDVVFNNHIHNSSNVHQNIYNAGTCIIASHEPISYNSRWHMPFGEGYGTGLKRPRASHDHVAAAAGPSSSSIHEQYPWPRPPPPRGGGCYSELMKVVEEGYGGKGLKRSAPTSHDDHVPVAAADAGSSSRISSSMHFNDEEYINASTGMKPTIHEPVPVPGRYSELILDNMNHNHPLVQLPTEGQANSDDIHFSDYFKQLEPLDQNMVFLDDDDDEHQPTMVPRSPWT